MNLEQLRQLETISQEGTISGAADLLNLSQPALTRSMQRLEKEYGQKFLTRQGRRLEFTEAGLIALEYAKRILREDQLLRQDLAALQEQTDILRVGTVAPAPLWHLTALLVERFPGLVLGSEMISETEIERRILSDTLALGITRWPHSLPGIRSCQLMTESLSVALPVDHPLASRRSVSAADFGEETFLLSAHIGFWQEYCDTHFSHCHFIVQEDHNVFEQMLHTTALPFFQSDAPALRRNVPGRKLVPLSDLEAHATFYLLTNENSEERVQASFDWVRRGEPTGPNVRRISGEAAGREGGTVA